MGNRGDHSAWPAAIPDLFLGLPEVVLKIWKDLKFIDTTQKEEVIKQFDGLKWRLFDQSPVEKSNKGG
jgi:hypothetical protein